MSLYSLVLRQLLDRLPNRLTEEFAGPFYELSSKILSMENRPRLRYAGIDFTNPFGVASGWADTISKINALHRLGAGAVVSKTITIEPKSGNPYPRFQRIGDSMVNSMGLPNQGLNYWSYQLEHVEVEHPTFLSIKGNTIGEWRQLITELAPYTKILELNLSCPNVKGGILDVSSTISILESIQNRSIKTKKFLKLSPQYSNRQLLDLVEQALDMDLIDGITVFNTKPVKTKYVGNPTHSAGYSGPKLYPRLVDFLSDARQNYTHKELPIFALGGIQEPEQADEILREFKSFPFFLTALLMNGPLIFREWTNKIFT